MNLLLPLDFETTGFPVWSEPSEGDNQPHIVQMAAILVDADTRKELQSIDIIIKPDGWEVPPLDDPANVHGITHEMAMDIGIPEKQAVDMFLTMCGDAKRIAHNRTFDQRIMRIALMRYGFPEADIERWAEKDNFFCTMYGSKPIVKQPNVGRAGIKNPKLEEAYRFFTGNEPKNAHNAMADTRMCLDVYFGIIDHNK